jgi:hypothetical protein
MLHSERGELVRGDAGPLTSLDHTAEVKRSVGLRQLVDEGLDA